MRSLASWPEWIGSGHRSSVPEIEQPRGPRCEGAFLASLPAEARSADGQAISLRV
jgi:hypothetical protein